MDAPLQYFVYENHSGGGRARVHVSTCQYCNGGLGLHDGAVCDFGTWHGPFTSAQEALDKASAVAKDARACGKCKPMRLDG